MYAASTLLQNKRSRSSHTTKPENHDTEICLMAQAQTTGSEASFSLRMRAAQQEVTWLRPPGGRGATHPAHQSAAAIHDEVVVVEVVDSGQVQPLHLQEEQRPGHQRTATTDLHVRGRRRHSRGDASVCARRRQRTATDTKRTRGRH